MESDRKRTDSAKPHSAGRAIGWLRGRSTNPARRTWLRKLAVLGAAPILSGCERASIGSSQEHPASPAGAAPPTPVPFSPPAPVPTSIASAARGGSPARYIDIHCHIFNARDVDKALEHLYAYCVDNGIPIMAHCAATNGTSHKNAMCADPVFWHEALSNPKQPKFRTLRVNLGHFGGVWNLDKTMTQTGVDVSWTGYIVRMIEDNDFPNLYTDFGDFSVVLGRSKKELEQRKTIFEQLHKLVANPENTKIRSRLMYGSDWLLLGREPGFEAFYTQMHDYLLQELEMSPDQLFWQNAARYLGLAQGNKTLERLGKFYSDNKRDPAVLDPFQP